MDIHRCGRMRNRSGGNEIRPSLGVGADILERDAAVNLERLPGPFEVAADSEAWKRVRSGFSETTLLVDAILESGVTQDFLLRRLGESRPRSLRLAVLVDKPARRRVALEPDYFGFRTASNQVWVGYGLAAANGTGRNLRQLSSGTNGATRKK